MAPIHVGEQAPDFTLPSTAGGETTLSAGLETGPAAVVFTRGEWCSYCAEQLQTFSALDYDLWRNLDLDVVAIGGDALPELAAMRDRFELSIQLHADTDLEVSRQYTGIEASEKHGEIPVTGTFVVDPEGIVQYAQVATNPADRTYANYVRHFVNSGFEKPY